MPVIALLVFACALLMALGAPHSQPAPRGAAVQVLYPAR